MDNFTFTTDNLPKFERIGHRFELPDFELEEGETHYIDLSDEYFEQGDSDSSWNGSCAEL